MCEVNKTLKKDQGHKSSLSKVSSIYNKEKKNTKKLPAFNEKSDLVCVDQRMIF